MAKKYGRIAILLLLTLILVFSLCACGSQQPPSPSNTGSPDESLSALASDTSSPVISPTDTSGETPSKADTFTVIYDGNGATSGDAPVDSSNYNQGGTATVLDNTGNLAEDGYTFNGWNTTADGSGTAYAAGVALTMDDADVTLYAQWVSNTASPSPSPTGTTAVKPTVTPDKTHIAVGGKVSFDITTADNVNQIQTFIDGVAGSTYTSYTTGTGTRAWQAGITFTVSGNRKVQFKCTLNSGSTSLIPTKAIVIYVSSGYSVTPTAASTITSGSSITYTVGTPSAITSVYALVDGVKQSVITTYSSDSGGIRKWKVVITFHKTGARSVKFSACTGTAVEKTFPSTAITVTVS